MKITKLKTNRMYNPLGFALGCIGEQSGAECRTTSLGCPRFSYVVEETEGKKQAAARIQVAADEGFDKIIFDSGRDENISNLAYSPSIVLKPRTRYYWHVEVWADNGDTAVSDIAWFETAKLDEAWQAKWISPELTGPEAPYLFKSFQVRGNAARARAYISGLGMYELYINGERVSDEYFAPYCNAYDKWIQYQTYDVTELIKDENDIGVYLGNGWYKGPFGFQGKENLFGDTFSLLCEIVLEYEDGTTEVIGTDGTWKAKKSKILSNGIYAGEVFDQNFEEDTVYGVKDAGLGYDLLTARLSLPVIVKETIKPVEIITTPAGETVLSMGQNMVGWLTFKTSAPKGTEIFIQHGEILQDGNFYNANLRTSKAEYKYICDGNEHQVRPYFTFYGFQYAKVTGWPGTITPEDFTGCVLYSDIEPVGNIETGDPLVNKLFLNALWGQKGNFLDIPTDCPQRDERMGWTGDAQVFSGTACYNMDSYAFFNKYLFDMGKEQEKFGGAVPHVVPDMLKYETDWNSACAWGDAATVIPWNVYLHYGDRAILEQQFESMKSWVDYIRREDEKAGGGRLWRTGFHFADWLALDGPDPGGVVGGTDQYFIASAFYSYSAGLTAKAARVLGMEDMAKEYETLSQEVKEAMRLDYFTATGRIAINTQTALVLSLFMDIAPPEFREKIQGDLIRKMNSDNNHLKTGFVGTPYLCRTLSDNGGNDLAYELLMNKDYPSWLYEVLMGATTIWERWNSVLPDGKISGTEMNSLNHYAYGSIVEWMYRNCAGLIPDESFPGFKKIKLAPQPNYRIGFIDASYASASGAYRSRWEISEDNRLSFTFEIPFDAEAELTLPDADLKTVKMNGTALAEAGISARQEGDNVMLRLVSGRWDFEYEPIKDYNGPKDDK